jgi:hypothetical protein
MVSGQHEMCLERRKLLERKLGNPSVDVTTFTTAAHAHRGGQ